MKIGSLERRIGLGLQFFAKFFNQVSDQEVSLTDDDKSWYWSILVCPMCTGRDTDSPVCHLAVGVLQGALENFVDSDKRFNVSPTHCIGQGDEKGIVAIDKDPL
jgi:predicted hydrocarbon binding protein